MDFITHDHRFALNIVESNKELNVLWHEIIDSITAITDDVLINEFPKSRNRMSLSYAINSVLDKELKKRDWTPQSAIFQGSEYTGKRWKLDFSKKISKPEKGITGMAVEVAFNHGEAIAWNLIKPVLAAEINQVKVQTDIGSGVGIYICATADLKEAGGFDGAVGEYEKVLRYLNPMAQKLTAPLVIVGLQPPKSFRISKEKDPITKKTTGTIVKI